MEQVEGSEVASARLVKCGRSARLSKPKGGVGDWAHPAAAYNESAKKIFIFPVLGRRYRKVRGGRLRELIQHGGIWTSL